MSKESKLTPEQLKEVQEIVMREKLKQVEDRELHMIWINWYKDQNRKAFSKKKNMENLNTMIMGMAADFYMIVDELKNQIAKLQDGKADITMKPLKEFNDEQTVTD